ncbi:MAG: HEAT repeat domain-containing protein [Saprospiraceae bacterium]|nr:HEAT repeat domain-containing protein [Saprospiraceae bacterium]
MRRFKKISFLYLTLVVWGFYSCTDSSNDGSQLHLSKNAHIMLIGNNLGSRMMNFGPFETEMHLRYPDSTLYIRNICDPGDTPGFRPRAGRVSPWAFPGAEKFQTELAQNSGSQGHFETPDQWLTRHKADIIIGFFGFNEAFNGEEGLEMYKEELDAFIKYTRKQDYNGEDAPQLAIISPIAMEDRSADMDVPDGKATNINLALYTEAMREVCDSNKTVFVDVFHPSQEWYKNNTAPLTIDGSQLNAEGYQIFGKYIVDKLFGNHPEEATQYQSQIHAAVKEKNWFWHNDYKIPNGVHVFGRRYEPFGPDNYPAELKKIREMTAIRDTAIWEAAHGKKKDLVAADAKTSVLPPVETNYVPSEKNGSTEYLYGDTALNKLHTAPGYKIEMFASEREFPDLANPVQISFDNKGRLWVAVMPSYPHYKPGDSKPNDKLLIFEDTDGDGKADKETVFADSLHLPIGFEFAPEGVYLSQAPNLVLLKDLDGDDHYDEKEILLSGFDDHDTHHAISAFVADPSGAIFMGEGVFLHTNVETSYGPVRATNGGFYRYQPQMHKLERHAQLSIPNPWGIAFDDWGEHFFAETSGPDVRWMLPGSVKPRYGIATHKGMNLIEDAHRVRPTSGLEFVSSRHFPEEVQGDLLINNTIGFLGTKMHKMQDDGTGYLSHHELDLVKGDDKNFRPVDMEFAPDGSLYLIDWHNILIGHMQHNARDPFRDHVHGRIYRITYPSRPLVIPAKVAGATIEELLDNLKLPEYRTRYRTRRELRGRDKTEVLSKLRTWADHLDKSDPNYEHNLLEGLWVSWGLDQVDETLLRQLLQAKDFRARAAAVRVLRYTGHQVASQGDYLIQAAQDESGRVRLEAITAASWLSPEKGIPIVEEAGKKPMDEWIIHAYETALAHLNGHAVDEKKEEEIVTHLKGSDRELFIKGKELFEREGYCVTCHQPDGNGLESSGFPPLAGTEWVLGNQDRLIKVVLKAMMGPIEIKGKTYPGNVPMTPFGGLMNDEEIAAVLTFVRNSFTNRASVISAARVKEIREQVADKKGFYTSEELLAEHPKQLVN